MRLLIEKIDTNRGFLKRKYQKSGPPVVPMAYSGCFDTVWYINHYPFRKQGRTEFALTDQKTLYRIAP
jgi:hypothetical protein